MVGTRKTRTPDLYRVNFEVTNPKPFPHLAFPHSRCLKRVLEMPSFDGELMASCPAVKLSRYILDPCLKSREAELANASLCRREKIRSEKSGLWEKADNRRSSPGRHDGGELGWHTAQNAPRFLCSRGPASTEAALLTDSARRGFAISFFTSRRTASLNNLFLFLRGITPSSCHAPKAKNGQFRPDEEILEMHSCRYDARPCSSKSAQEPQRPHSCRKMLRREL